MHQLEESNTEKEEEEREEEKEERKIEVIGKRKMCRMDRQIEIGSRDLGRADHIFCECVCFNIE